MIWYPETPFDCCSCNDCLYHVTYRKGWSHYACDFYMITGHCKINDPDYTRNDPPSSGCSLYVHATPEQKQKAADEARARHERAMMKLTRWQRERPELFKDFLELEFY